MCEQQLPISELRTDAAALLGDLSLVVQDLRSVIELCRRSLRELEGEQQDAWLAEALWTAALVKYVRCFTSGKRFGVKREILGGLEGDPIGAHKYFKDMRDKHVAHSVNPFEEIRVGVVLSTPGMQPQVVEGIAVLSRKLIYIEAEGVRTLMQLASALHKRIASQAQDLQGKLLEWAKAQPVENFRIGPLGIATPDAGQAGKARS